MGVNGDLASVGWGVFGEVGVLHVIVGEALLQGAIWVVIGVDSHNCVEPRFLDQ